MDTASKMRPVNRVAIVHYAAANGTPFAARTASPIPIRAVFATSHVATTRISLSSTKDSAVSREQEEYCRQREREIKGIYK